MRLTPRQPPGRLSRKALAFESEISRLRGEGHTCEAIRLALFDAGLTVSRSTVKREVARYATRPFLPEPTHALARSVNAPAAQSIPDARPHLALADDPRSSKEIAEAFVKGRITNPLLRKRTTHESSRH